MATSSARRSASATKRRTAVPTERQSTKPLIIYIGRSLDGTSFALDPESQARIRKAFPTVHVSTRHVFVAHDTHELVSESIHRFDKQVTALLSGMNTEQLTQKFMVSFRDPYSEQELARLVSEPKVA